LLYLTEKRGKQAEKEPQRQGAWIVQRLLTYTNQWGLPQMNRTFNHLSPPVFPDSVVERLEVNRAIDAAMKKNIVYMHAPAGFGKTIAMSMWLSGNGLPAAWIPLTVYDDEPSVFCRYLLTALAGFDGGAAEAAKAALGDPGFAAAPFEYFFKAVSSLPNEISGGIIVMDDFHLIENPSILNVLPLIIRKLSQIYKIAIISRLNPPVSFADLAIKNEIGELNENDLRFTKKQIMRLYKGFGIALSQGEASEIEEKTGGWALGLGAELLTIKAGGTESFLSRASGEQYINGYLKREVWDKWDAGTQDFLLKTSILEDLTPELCDRLCSCDSEKVLSELMNNSGLVVRLPDGSYRYHHILRDFLRWMAEGQGIALSDFYVTSADYLLEKGKLNVALDYAVKSGDFEAITRALYWVFGQGTTIKSVEEYCNSIISNVLKKIPTSVLESNMYALSPCTLASNLNGNLDIFYKWHAKINEYLEGEKDVEPWFQTGIWLYEFINPQNSIRDIIKIYSSRFSAFDSGNQPPPIVTCNFPFFHRSHRDYSDFADAPEELAPAYISALNTIYGDVVLFFTIGLECGIFYEQNKLRQAKEKAVTLLSRLDKDLHTEFIFSAYMHLAAIEFAGNDEESAWNAIHKAQTVVERDGLYLLKNLNAMIVIYKLYKGARNAAKEWLARNTEDDNGELKFYEIYQTIASIRARIVLGEFASALVIMSKLEELVTDYRRPLDQMEIHILRAIILWNEKQRTDAAASMEKAILLAQPYGFTRIFADEGAAVIPILQKLYNRLSRKPEQSDAAVFVRNTLFVANESAKIFPGLINKHESNPDKKPVKLSKQQMRMLLFLASGKNNRQICEETGLKLNTVKAHLFILYEKLDVNTATDAVLKAYQLGILEKTLANE